MAPGRVEHAVGLDPGAVAQRHAQACAAVEPRDALDVDVRAQIDALLAHLVGQEGAHVVVEAAQDLLAAVELRDLRAEALEDRGELARDVAAADDDEAARKLGQVEDLVRRDRELAAGNVRRGRPAAGRDQDLRGAVGLAVDRHRIRPGEPGPAVDQRDAGVAEQPVVDVVEARDLDRAVALQHLPVEHRRRDVPAEAVRFLERVGVVGREAVQLLRDAAEVDAGAAERGILGDRDADAALRGEARGPHPAAAGTDDEEVEIC